MRCLRASWLGALGLFAFASLVAVGQTFGQVVINEIVKEERTAGSGSTTDTREFVELYNAGATAVDISGWTISTWRLTGNTADPNIGNPGAYYGTDVIQAGTILAPGGYFVIGGASVPNVNQVLGFTEIHQDNQATIMELRSGAVDTVNPDNGAPLVDAVAYDIYRASLTPPANTTFVAPTAGQASQIGTGYWGQHFSINVDTSQGNVPATLARYRDGKDSNKNGLDFGHLPVTPGASNIAPGPAFTIPDVDALALPVGSHISNGVHASFLLPRVVNPAQASSINPTAISPSPQGGNAIIAWDETGGGNAIYSKTLVNKFDLWAYLDTSNLGGISAGESTTYGIGTTDPFYATPDPTDDLLLPATTPGNGNAGIGWVYQKDFTTSTSTLTTKLVLADFGDSGNSKPSAGEWTILETIDLQATAEPSKWHHLGIDYDPATGQVVATYDNQTFTHTVSANRDGNFFVGYRELIPQVPGTNNALARPATFDFFEPVVEDADFDNDGDVDGSDFLAWQRGLTAGGSATNATGDANGDGNVNSADLAIWKNKFGQPAVAAAATVPEPGAFTLGGLALTLLLGLGRNTAKRLTDSHREVSM